MSKYEIPFLTACIQAFGRRFSMTRQAAFRYLHEHKGLAFFHDEINPKNYFLLRKLLYKNSKK